MKSHKFLKTLNILLFIILMIIGLLYILAAPVNPVTAGSRILIGVILIIVAVVLLIVISLLIQRSKYKVEKVIVKRTEEGGFISGPEELICKNCGNAIKITAGLKMKKKVICEKCGEEILIPKDNIDW